MLSNFRVFSQTMAIPLDFADREALIRITTTSLSSKVLDAARIVAVVFSHFSRRSSRKTLPFLLPCAWMPCYTSAT